MTHEDVNPSTVEVEDKHFWLVFGSGWHHGLSRTRCRVSLAVSILTPTFPRRLSPLPLCPFALEPRRSIVTPSDHP